MRKINHKLQKPLEKPPSELVRIIEVAKLIPQDFEWLHPVFLSEVSHIDEDGTVQTLKWLQSLRTEPELFDLNLECKLFEEIWIPFKKQFPKEIQSLFIVETSDRFTKLLLEREAYKKILQETQGLREYALGLQIYQVYLELKGQDDDFFTEIRDLEFTYLGEEFLKKLNPLSEFPVPIPKDGNSKTNYPFFMTVNKLHAVGFQGNDLTNAMKQIDGRRLRICPACNHVFWAYSLKRKQCSKKCTDIHLQSERRSLKRDEINKQRRRNYYKKKNIYYCEVCVFPFKKYNCTYIDCNCPQKESNNASI